MLLFSSAAANMTKKLSNFGNEQVFNKKNIIELRYHFFSENVNLKDYSWESGSSRKQAKFG